MSAFSDSGRGRPKASWGREKSTGSVGSDGPVRVDYREPLEDSELEARALEKTNDVGVKAKTSMWGAIGILSLGLLTWVGYLYIGLRANHRPWKRYALPWLVASVLALGMVIPGLEDGTFVAFLGVILILFMLIFTLIAVSFTNPTWLMAIARRKVVSSAA